MPISLDVLRTHVERELKIIAKSGKTVSYSDLWDRAGYNPKWRRFMGEITGDISETELSLGNPPISAIVILESTGYPSGGFFGLSLADLPTTQRRTTKLQFKKALTLADRAYIDWKQTEVWRKWR